MTCANVFGWAVLSLYVFLVAMPASAAVYNEAINGDLSNNQFAPTPFTLTTGSNSIIGVASFQDSQDFVVVTIPGGFKLDTYINAAYSSGSDAQAFTGFHAGSTFPGSPFLPASYSGYAHFGPGAENPGVNDGLPTSTVGVNLLPFPYMADNSVGGTAEGAVGYSPPLPAGSYTFLIQQLGASTSYEFTLGVSAVSIPGDFDSDGDVDGADFVIWQTNFPAASGATLATGDADNDGDVDGADFVVWQTNFPTTPASPTVPEPLPIYLLASACIALAVFRPTPESVT